MIDDEKSFTIGFIIGLCICLGGVVTMIISQHGTLAVGYPSLQEVCQKLGGNDSINYEVSVEYKNLVCIAPSYDNTQKIIFKTAGEDDGD